MDPFSSKSCLKKRAVSILAPIAANTIPGWGGDTEGSLLKVTQKSQRKTTEGQTKATEGQRNTTEGKTKATEGQI